MEEAKDWAGEAEARVLEAALRRLLQAGWNRRLVMEAGRAAGLTGPETELLLPGGARDLAALYARRLDEAALAALKGIDPEGLKVRERIRQGASAWLEAACADLTASRRWTGFLALPANLALGLRLAWSSADGLWRWAGDTATDENHYSKRGLLAGILISSLTMRLAHGAAAGAEHLDRAISGVMRLETWKRGLAGFDPLTRAAQALGRLRYRGALAD